MGTQETEIINSVISRTQSDLILFFVLIVIALVLVLLPLYAMVMKDRKAKHTQENTRQDRYIEREKQIIQVVTANTEVMAGLKATLENLGANTNTSFMQIKGHLSDQDRILNDISTAVAKMQTTVERNTNNQGTIIDGVNKTLLIVSNISNGGID